jgi:hypothetical protein
MNYEMRNSPYAEMYDGFGGELRPSSTVLWAGDVYRVLAFGPYGVALVLVRADDVRAPLVYAQPHETELVVLVDNNPSWYWFVNETWVCEPEISMRHVGGRWYILGNDDGDFMLLDYDIEDEVDRWQDAVRGTSAEQLMKLVD